MKKIIRKLDDFTHFIHNKAMYHQNLFIAYICIITLAIWSTILLPFLIVGRIVSKIRGEK